jgi:hypothetical protein
MRLFLLASLIAGVVYCVAEAVPTTVLSLPNGFWLGLCLTLLVAELVFGGLTLPARRPPA